MALGVGIWGNPSISLAADPPKVSGGSVVLVGLEPEDGHLENGRRAHGPISAYVNIIKKNESYKWWKWDFSDRGIRKG